jgi:hypothetical protein
MQFKPAAPNMRIALMREQARIWVVRTSIIAMKG